MFGSQLAACGLVAAFSCALAPSLSANVIVVAPSGGQFTDIQPAIKVGLIAPARAA